MRRRRRPGGPLDLLYGDLLRNLFHLIGVDEKFCVDDGYWERIIGEGIAGGIF